MLLPLLCSLFAATAISWADSTAFPETPPARDSSQAISPKVVRRMAEVIVRAQFHDPLSSESVRLLSGRAARRLPVEDLAEVVALQAGVVARGGDLHVRGGRAGESVILLQGMPLNDPLRRGGMEIPLLAVRDADVLLGGLDAEYGGALAGVTAVRTVDPPERPDGAFTWETDGRTFTHYDHVAGRIGAPLPFGLGIVATADAMLDDTNLPYLRTIRRRNVLGGSFGWRADNHLAGHLKLARLGAGSRFALELLANRSVEEPYNPMWTVDGWTTPSTGTFGEYGPGYSDEPIPGYEYYRAADHWAITDDRRAAALLSWTRPFATSLASATLGWLGTRRLTSVGGGDDDSYLTPARLPIFGRDESPTNDPFHVYVGDEPYFHRSTSATMFARADLERVTPRGNRAKAGAGFSEDVVRSREMDLSTYLSGYDSLRVFHATAPGAYGYAQGRWVFEGMVLNGGLRAEWFTPGPQAEEQSFAGSPHGVLSLSPRLGVAYPISVRDVFSLAYGRFPQAPARDFLYENRDYVSRRSQLGNPDLRPATMISYQGAVKHTFGPEWAFQTAFFYRDLYDLVGTRLVTLSRAGPQPRYENVDEGHATGFELSLFHVGGETRRAELHYTWMTAWGTASSEEGVVESGTRLPPTGEHPLDWDRRHTLAFLGSWRRGRTSISWSAVAGSGFPWTPRTRRQPDADLSLLNHRRLGLYENTNLRVGWHPLGGPLRLGLEVRNLFDHRSETAVTWNGYPHPLINTYYDDYSAYRTETGEPGGAYWEDANGDGLPGWQPVHDPRLFQPPRALRVSIAIGE